MEPFLPELFLPAQIHHVLRVFSSQTRPSTRTYIRENVTEHKSLETGQRGSRKDSYAQLSLEHFFNISQKTKLLPPKERRQGSLHNRLYTHSYDIDYGRQYDGQLLAGRGLKREVAGRVTSHDFPSVV